MLRFLKRIGRRLGLVKLASGGEVPTPKTVYVYRWSPQTGLMPVDCHFAAQRRWADADYRLQLAAEQFAAAVIDALQNG